MVKTSVEILKTKAVEHGTGMITDIENGIPDQVVGDPQRLQQIILNLLSNAVKFTERGKITLSLSNVGKQSLRFSVSDTGIGIPEDKQKAIFQPFTQAESSTTRRFGGTGLGLSICQKLVEMMGGKIWVVSQLGHGSVFHVEIPFQQVSLPTPVTEGSSDAGAGAGAGAGGWCC